MPEIKIRLVDWNELKLDQSFLHFNVKEKIYTKNSLK